MGFKQKLYRTLGIVDRNEAVKAIRYVKNQHRSFKAAVQDRFVPSNWGSDSTINQDIKAGGSRLQAVAKDAEQNSDYAKNIIRTYATNTVPAGGMRLQVRGKNKNGDLDETYNTIIENAWKDFSKKENYTPQGMFDRYMVEDMMVRHLYRDGELLAQHVRVKGINKYGYAIRPLNPRWIDSDYSVSEYDNNSFVAMGIRFSNAGKILSIFLRKPKKSNQYSYAGYKVGEREEIPFSQLIYGFLPDFADQDRGYSQLAQSILGLKKIDGYEDYGFIAAQIGAAGMVFFQNDNEMTMSPDPEDILGDRKDDDGNFEMDIEPGVGRKLPPGWKASPFTPDFPTAMHGEYMKTALKGRLAGAGVDYPSGANDWEGVNYTSSRTAMLASRKNYLRFQFMFTTLFVEPVYQMWLKSALSNGSLKINDEYKNDFIAQFEKYTSVEITGERWAFVDPVKEATAEIMLINNKLKSYRRYFAERGIDMREEMKDYAEDLKLFGEFGLTPGDASKYIIQTALDDEAANTDEGKSFMTIEMGGNGNGRH